MLPFKKYHLIALCLFSFFIKFSILSIAQDNMARHLNKTVGMINEKNCEKNGGYWYKEKCWANYKDYDESLEISDVDQYVKSEIENSRKHFIKVNGQKFQIGNYIVEEIPDEKIIAVFLTFKTGKGTKTLLQLIPTKKINKKQFKMACQLLDIDLTKVTEEEFVKLLNTETKSGIFENTLIKKENHHYESKGKIVCSKTNRVYNIELSVSDDLGGLGDSTLEIKEGVAYLNGTLGTRTYVQIKDMIQNNPSVKKIVLENVPRSINDLINMHTGRILREAGITTIVNADSDIASGGVDLFSAGKERIVHKGAKLGIHSWGGDGISANDLKKDHPAHQYQIKYFEMCLGKTKGEAFYFKTIEAAPADDIYYMNDQEIRNTVATKFLE